MSEAVPQRDQFYQSREKKEINKKKKRPVSENTHKTASTSISTEMRDQVVCMLVS